MPRGRERSHLVAALLASVWASTSGVVGCVADDTAAEPSLGPRSGTAPPPSSGAPDATLPDGSLDARADGPFEASDASSDADASEDAGPPDADAGDAEPPRDASDAGGG